MQVELNAALERSIGLASDLKRDLKPIRAKLSDPASQSAAIVAGPAAPLALLGVIDIERCRSEGRARCLEYPPEADCKADHVFLARGKRQCYAGNIKQGWERLGTYSEVAP